MSNIFEPFINKEKLNAVFTSRNEVKNDFSCVIKNFDNLREFKNIINELNLNIKSILKDKYIPYTDNLHITAIGLEGFGDLILEEKNNIFEYISLFPNITPSNFNISLLDNGLIVAQIFFEKKERELLKQWRALFESIGFKYAHEKLSHQMHSVIGMINPNADTPNNEELSLVINTFSDFIKFLDNSHISFSKDDLNIFKYKYTSFIECIIITQSEV